MVVENFNTFSDWIQQNLFLFGVIIVAATLLGVVVGYLISLFKNGPFEAFYVVAQVIAQAIPDFIYTSPRRILAIARLAVKEAMHRKVILVAFGIFAASLLFGGWFVDNGSENPEQIYINFVLFGTQLLVLMMGMLLSAFSIPEDIKHRTIFTVVTKPVRATEIVLGRLFGFGFVGTALLALMGILSYFFVYRGLAHEHTIADASQSLKALVDIDQQSKISSIDGRRVSENAIKECVTTVDSGHRHKIELIQDIRSKTDQPPLDTESILSTKEIPGDKVVYERLICDTVGGHRHKVSIEGTGEDAKIVLSNAAGYFRARVPVYCDSLKFTDTNGGESTQGINVGKEWGYRGYVDGGSSAFSNSLSEARFDFVNLKREYFADRANIPLEMTLSVFRTYKADIQRRVIAGIQLESVPDTELDNTIVSDLFDFETNEYTVQTLPIPVKLAGKVLSPDKKTINTGTFDLFDDYAKNGKLRIRLTCREASQYIGVARGDVYFRGIDQNYTFNFFKGYLGIWCQMMIIIAMGVALSTFLNSPITMLGTFVIIIIGFFTNFIRDLIKPDAEGGGPIESLIRVITQQNMVTELEAGLFTTIVEQTDKFLVALMVGFTYLAPDFVNFNFAEYLTKGYAIDINRVFVALALTLIFCIAFTILGYFSLKTREIAK